MFENVNWDDKKIIELHNYLITLDHVQNNLREQNIINTKYYFTGVKSKELDKLSKEIVKGDYKAFLRLNKYKIHEDFILNGFIINKIKDFSEFKYYLLDYLKYADSWAHTDIFKFNTKKYEKEFFSLSKDLIKSENIFERRLAIRILFNYINIKYIDEIFLMIEKLYDESEYYVNMCVAWLLCDMVIKIQDKALSFLKNGKINKFVKNKAISKCNDSFRISSDVKLILKELRVK